MRRRLGYYRVVLAAVAALASNRNAAAQVVLDQSNVVPNFQFDAAVVDSQQLSQTFTVGVNGTLDKIGAQVYKNTGTTNDLVLTIRTVIAGVPDTSDPAALFTEVIPLADLPTIDNPFGSVPITLFDVSSAGIPVTVGEQLAIALARPGGSGPPWVTWRSGSDTYAPGQEYSRGSSAASWNPLPFVAGGDAGFQTYVKLSSTGVPEPAAPFALLIGASVFGVCLRRRKR